MSRYVVINNQKVYLTPSQQKAWDKMIHDARHTAQREGRCGQPDYRKCFGDCALCPYQKQGTVFSMNAACDDDEPVFGDYRIADNSRAFEDAILDTMMLDALYRSAGRHEPKGDEILRMFLAEGLSSYEIATRLGLRQTTVNDRLRRLFAYISANRERLLGL